MGDRNGMRLSRRVLVSQKRRGISLETTTISWGERIRFYMLMGVLWTLFFQSPTYFAGVPISNILFPPTIDATVEYNRPSGECGYGIPIPPSRVPGLELNVAW